MQDFAYRFIDAEGPKTTDEILEGYDNSNRGKIGLCNRRELSGNLSKSKLFVRENISKVGRQGNLNRWFTIDVKVVAERLASLDHLSTPPRLYPKILRDEYYACVAQREALNTMKESV